MAFQKVEVAAGNYMGWSNSKAGQVYEGTVVEYDEQGGTDYDVGEELSLTAGQANLKKAIKKAHRDFGLNRGVTVRIELDHFEKVPDGKVKVFDVQVDTSTRDTTATSAPADDQGGDDDDEPPF
jgi:hypothetical protein